MPTAASSAEVVDAGGSAFEAVHGFTTADVLKDKRFRVRHQFPFERGCEARRLGPAQLKSLLCACLDDSKYADRQAERLSRKKVCQIEMLCCKWRHNSSCVTEQGERLSGAGSPGVTKCKG